MADPFVVDIPFLSMWRMCLLEGQRVEIYSWGSKVEEMGTPFKSFVLPLILFLFFEAIR